MENHSAAAALVLDAVLTVQDRIRIAIEHLPHLSVDQIHLEECCPICLLSFQSIIVQSEQTPSPDSGITKVPGCGHVFCRKDLCEWIRGQHGTCPTCRHSFINIRPPSESDDESSDGGEYVPPEDMDEDEEDAFLEAELFTEANNSEFDVDEMDLEVDDFWGATSVVDSDTGYERDAEMGEGSVEEEEEWGLTDGESMFSSDVDMSLEERDELGTEQNTDDNVSVHCEDAEPHSEEGFDHHGPSEEEK